ncbi:nitroreductase [Vallitalea longa]|uniref:Nitroreductase n=1 Tax=Vallitalea longa TaxID=2936439 RepID=A0A9W5YAD7_9FIRM|nr:nitroreductase family protein [Vallitalea longa]GKX29489.1 nitroreductase [Vallitalea longa]
MKSFSAILKKSGRFTFFEIPFDASKVFDIKKGTIRVFGTINNLEFREKLTSRGNGKYILMANKMLQKRVGFVGSDLEIDVEMDLDKVALHNSGNRISLDVPKCKIDILQAIRERSTIRQFTDRKVEKKKIQILLESGFCAPNAKGKRPCHFIVSDDSAFLHKIADDSNHKTFKTATCCIVVCGDKNVEGINKFLIEDCSAATQNILLSAYGLGVGSAWIGLLKTCSAYEYIISCFSLPEKIIPVNLIALGYPDEEKPILPRYDSSKVHWNHW